MEDCSECDDCGRLFDDDQLNDGMCEECYGAEFLTCMICGVFVSRSDNQGDEGNPLCEVCAEVVCKANSGLDGADVHEQCQECGLHTIAFDDPAKFCDNCGSHEVGPE